MSQVAAVEDHPSGEQTTTLSVIVPTYNESENVEEAVRRTIRSVGSVNAEVVVIDDDSPDETWRLARESFADDERVRVVRRTEDAGLATAVLRGFEEAEGEVYAVMDADLQHPPGRLLDLLSALEQGDASLAVGSRHVEGGGIEKWSWTRKLVSRGASTLANLAVPDARGISDPMSGFFAVESDVVDGVDFDPRGYKILLEIIATCEPDRIVEVPYVFTERERGESNLTPDQYLRFVEHLGMLGLVSRGLDRRVDPARTVRAAEFGAVGAVGALVNALVFWGVTTQLGVYYLVAGVVAFLAAVQSNFVGNWMVTFDRPDGPLVSQWARFHAVSLAGFAVYTGVLFGLVDGFSFPEQVANLLAIAGASVWNFLGTESVAFKNV